MNLLSLFVWFSLCADQDARTRKVSNWITFGGILCALLYLLITGISLLGAPSSEAWGALLLTVILTVPGYALKKLGAGDVKLLFALALASSTYHILGTFIGAGATTVVWLLARQKIWPHMPQWFTSRYVCLSPESSNKQPFVPFLLAGFAGTAWYLH